MQAICKGLEKKSTQWSTVRDPRLVRRGTEKAAEDGLGAVLSIGRQCRVRPLKRSEAAKAVNQGGTTVNFIVLAFFARTIFHFLLPDLLS